MIPKNRFRFKSFSLYHDEFVMKVNTDAVLLGAWSDVGNKNKVLDIGTGTGVIALMLAQRNKVINVDAIDVEPASAALAQRNFSISPWSDRLKAYFLSVQELSVTTKHKYDLIVSNPPFFTGGTLSNYEHKSKGRHTIKLSHSDLLHSVQNLLDLEGHFDVVLPYTEGVSFVQVAEKYELYLQRVIKVHPVWDKPVERLLMRFGKNKINQQCETVVLLNTPSDKDFTDWYKNLTKDYYLFL